MRNASTYDKMLETIADGGGDLKTIRQLREDRGWSPVQLAARLDVSLATIYNWETGKYEPRASQLRRIAKEFGVSMDDIALEESPAAKMAA